eukprot:CAMPEP_0170555748 /NCGR_PEP_ID=MMETSP0211-20121228/13586_1 /TAXON_ID=311385 /ORGANISM="Pseudokeronopsis sp., Strain OXSARD2" /LENGTH=95 /DNA_ID=CAMNT_0010865731 /DNA_START=817 /DNA_END=1104 /DNA_ORIENTATION=-
MKERGKKRKSEGNEKKAIDIFIRKRKTQKSHQNVRDYLYMKDQMSKSRFDQVIKHSNDIINVYGVKQYLLRSGERPPKTAGSPSPPKHQNTSILL